jgi:hypothetical protein
MFIHGWLVSVGILEREVMTPDARMVSTAWKKRAWKKTSVSISEEVSQDFLSICETSGEKGIAVYLLRE